MRITPPYFMGLRHVIIVACHHLPVLLHECFLVSTHFGISILHEKCFYTRIQVASTILVYIT